MPHIIAIEYSDSQIRQRNTKLSELAKKGWPLSGRFEAQNFGSWEELFIRIVNPGLFVQREVIVIDNAEVFDNFPEKLARFIEDDNADCILILLYNSEIKNLKPIANSISIIKPEPQIPPWKRKDWLLSLAKEHKIKISTDAAQLLAESIESQEELYSELLKLGIFCEGREITIEDVNNLSFDEGGRAQLTFLDGLCTNKPIEIAHALKYLRSSPLLPVLTAVTNRLRPALIIAMFPGKYSDEALNAAGIDTTKKYNYALEKSRMALKNFGAERLKKFMFESEKLSFMEKTSRAEGWQSFEMLVWDLIAKNDMKDLAI